MVAGWNSEVFGDVIQRVFEQSQVDLLIIDHRFCHILQTVENEKHGGDNIVGKVRVKMATGRRREECLPTRD